MDRGLPLDDDHFPARLDLLKGDDRPGILSRPGGFEQVVFGCCLNVLTRVPKDAGEGWQIFFCQEQGLDGIFGRALPEIFQPVGADFVPNGREGRHQGVDPVADRVLTSKVEGIGDLVGCALRRGERLLFKKPVKSGGHFRIGLADKNRRLRCGGGGRAWLFGGRYSLSRGRQSGSGCLWGDFLLCLASKQTQDNKRTEY